MIKYIGSKRKLVEHIVAVAAGLPGVRSVCDLFSGTSRVGHAFKRHGYQVHANDHNLYAATLARCYVQADRRRVYADAERLVEELNALPGAPGYFTHTYCEASRYLKPKNGARVDAIRERIVTLSLDPDLEAVLLVSLMEAADRVDSTCGLQMAYLKRWAARADNDLRLRVPDLVDGPGSASQLDAIECARGGGYDLVYVDPPYNQHKYMNNYHVWESLVRWDKPDVYGIACKRVDCREYTSAYNSRKQIGPALRELLAAIDARFLIVSFNDEGYLDDATLRGMLTDQGALSVFSLDYKRYVGAQIGIYNPSGVKTGTVSHLRNRELLYVVDRAGQGQLGLALEQALG